MFTSVARVLDAKYSLTPCVGSSPASVSLSEFKCTYRVKVREPTDGREVNNLKTVSKCSSEHFEALNTILN